MNGFFSAAFVLHPSPLILQRMARRKTKLLQRLEYAAYRAAAGALRSASDEAILRWGSRLGRLGRTVIRGRDRLAMRNLRRVFPERSDGERRRILDDCWRHFGRETL